MAMLRRGREEAERALSTHRPFHNSTGSFYATRGSARDAALGWLQNHPEARRMKELLGRASYVVWSYDTPIGWMVEDEDGGQTRYYVDESFSRTTLNHQSILQVAWGEYEAIGSGPQGRSQRRRSVSRTAPSGPPEYLLDPRYADPNWSPGLPVGADVRDQVRVDRDLNRAGWHPAHP